ncbi:hypothetical protein [Brucella sp. 22210]|uniref:hypothetical protein n=1 Tax=Brucella sp. 22210 TaxID=3453892 RepID=UPI003F83AFF9
MNKPLIRPFRTSNGSYILHPAFVQGLIQQLSLQNFDNERSVVDWATAREEIQLAVQAFEEIAVADAQFNGETEETAQIQALGIFDSFVAGATGVQ